MEIDAVLDTPDVSTFGWSIEVDLRNPVEKEKKLRIFLFPENEVSTQDEFSD